MIRLPQSALQRNRRRRRRLPPVTRRRPGAGGGAFNYHPGTGKFGAGSNKNPLNVMGMPLDPMFEAERRNARDIQQASMTQLRNQRSVGLAGLAEQEMLGNRAIDEDMAARGLYGSGIERRDERLLGNDVARAKMDMLSQFTAGRSGAQMDFRRAMQDALLGLAQRSQGQKNLPLPKRAPKRRRPPRRKKKQGIRRPPPGGR